MNIFKDTITVYNVIPQHGREPEQLRRTILPRCFWDGSAGAGYNKLGETSQDSVSVIIPYRPEYLFSARWADAGYPEDRFTLKAGDIIVRGAVADEDITAAELLKKYGSECCIIVTEVHNCCYGSRDYWHWEVSGK